MEEQRGEERGSRRLGIMYFIMISQQNCNLQQAMSHTTPTSPPFHNASSTPFAPLHARFLCLVHFPSFPFSSPPTHVLSISPTLIISLSLAVSSSLHPPLSSSFPSNRLVSTNQTSLTVDAPAHTCKPSLTSDSKDLLSSNLYLHPPPSRLPPFSLWPPFSPYRSFTVSLSQRGRRFDMVLFLRPSTIPCYYFSLSLFLNFSLSLSMYPNHPARCTFFTSPFFFVASLYTRLT